MEGMMQRVLLVAWREFAQRARQRGFILSAVATPLILMIIWGATGLMAAAPPPEEREQVDQPPNVIGYVDRANLIEHIPDMVDKGLFRVYEDTDAAQAALYAGELEAYYVLPADYRQTGHVERVSLRLPTIPPDRDWFEQILLSNLLPAADAEDLARVRSPLGPQGPRFVPLDDERPVVHESPMLPFLVTLAIMVPLFTSGSYLLMSLAEEKSHRVVEILLSALRPRDLLAGKLLGLGALTLVQYLIWGAIGVVMATLFGRGLTDLLVTIRLEGIEVLLVLSFALGGYILYAGLMAGIGAMAPDLEGGRTWVFVITLPMMLPIYLWPAIVESPDGMLATALSLIPFSSPVAMLMRMMSAIVPTWQIALSLLLLMGTAVGLVALMARLFRAQTLLSGESLSIRRLVAALRS
jgi:ABC-2 type transport system permease protein